MDIRKQGNYRLIVETPNTKLEFIIDFNQVLILLTSIGKPVSITLTDIIGDPWVLNVINYHAEIDSQSKTITLYYITSVQ